MIANRVVKFWCVALTACGAPGGSGSAAPPRPSESCVAIQNEARAELMSAIEANNECTQASDCITVAFAASCFDSCSRAIATEGKAAFEAAIGSVNGGRCKAYTDASCPRPEIPPCAPPAEPQCIDGRCQ